MALSPKSRIFKITAVIVSLQLALFTFFLIKKEIHARQTEAYALETLREIQSGNVKEVVFYDSNMQSTIDELTPAKIAGWEKRIDELKWLGDDAFNRMPYSRYQVGTLNVEIAPNRIIRIELYDHREHSYDELPTPKKFKGFCIAYTHDRGFMMK
jgi:hypothetical protein